jgi:hypothetical protein
MRARKRQPGGYGIGGGSPVFAGRAATGTLGRGPSVRAFAVADGRGGRFAIADIETQGWFVATKDGPYGLLDMRKAVERRTGGRLAAERVVVQTDHSHAGADTIGVWGGVPLETAAISPSEPWSDRRGLRDDASRGDPIVAARSYLVEDVSSNALILGFEYAGGAVGIPLNRSSSPPWLAGNVLGTVTASARIGDVLLSAGPGEMYPQIPLKLASIAPARGCMTAGLANDQLGYLIAPYEAYPEPIRRSFFDQEGDEVEPISNDNYFFNVSQTMGERVTCSLLRGAGEVFRKGLEYRGRYDRCAAFANDLLLGHGADTGF